MKKLYCALLFFTSVLLFAQVDQIVEAFQESNNEIYTFIKDKSYGQIKKNNIATETYLANQSFETWLPAGWEIYNEGAGGWNQSNSDSYTGSSSVFSNGLPYSSSWLISPEIDLTTASSAFLTFFERISNSSGGDDYPEILISSEYEAGTGLPFTSSYTISEISDFYPHPWDKRTWDLSEFLGNTIHIAFYYYNDSETFPGFDWYIDDISVTDDGSTICNGDYGIPSSATLNSPPDYAQNMQLNIPISWSPPFSDDVTKQLLYVGTDGGGTVSPTSIHNGEEQFPFTSGLNLTNLLPNTTYYWQVVPTNCAFEAENCPIWSFTTGDGNIHYGGGSSTQGNYYFANSTSGAAASPYQPSYNWIDISSGTDIISSIGNDETLGPFNIGFNFDFFGNSYSQFYINSNGFITFENTSGQTNFPHPFPSTNGVNNLIAGYYMDLDPTNTNVSDKHIYYGNNNGDLIITFEKIPQLYWDGSQYQPVDADGWLTFQIILFQNGNVKIQFKEKGTSFIVDDFYTGEVGMENSDGTQGILYKRNFYGGPIFDGTSPLAVEFYKNNLVSANVELNILLEGPFSGGTMSFSANNIVPLNQPYNTPAFGYNGSETTTSGFISSNNIVDWVYIELRSGSSASTATTVIAKRAALVQNTGVVLDTEGSTDIDFGMVQPGDYYIVVYHRNHLPIISSQAITITNEIGVGF